MRFLGAHSRLAAFGGLVLVAMFVLGLRWGLYLPINDVRMITYASVEDGVDPRLVPADGALFRSGRSAALTRRSGYLGILMEREQVDRLFGAIDRAAHGWSPRYPTTTTDTRSFVINLTFADGRTTTVQIDAPDTNLEVPRDLRDVTATLNRLRLQTIGTGQAIGELPLRLVALPVDRGEAGTIIYDLPNGYRIDAVAAPGGVAVTTDDVLVQAWSLNESLLAPGNRRMVRTNDGRLYRLAVLIDWAALQR